MNMNRNYNNNWERDRYEREYQEPIPKEPTQRIRSFEDKELPMQGRVNPNNLSSINQTNLNNRAVMEIEQSKDEASDELDDSWISKD